MRQGTHVLDVCELRSPFPGRYCISNAVMQPLCLWSRNSPPKQASIPLTKKSSDCIWQVYCCRVLHVLVQSATPGQAQQWQQEQQTYKDSVRTSTPATIQNALNNFNGVQMNPSKLYAPGAPPSNNAPLTPQEQGTVAAPQASQPATVVCKPFPQLLSR